MDAISVHETSGSHPELTTFVTIILNHTFGSSAGSLLAPLPRYLVSFPDHLSSACIASSITILKAIRAGVGWVWDQDY